MLIVKPTDVERFKLLRSIRTISPILFHRRFPEYRSNIVRKSIYSDISNRETNFTSLSSGTMQIENVRGKVHVTRIEE